MPAMYVYGVVAAGAGPGPYRSLAGLEDQSVALLASGAVAALVSPLGGERARGTRANLSAHQRVVEEARRAGPVLPVRFGTIMPDEDAVIEDLLAPREAELEDALREMSGKSEFRVKARYLTDVVVREAVERDARVRRMRDALARRGGGGYHERIELGERVAAAVGRIREDDEEAVLAQLRRVGVPLRPLDATGTEVALHVAALVADGKRSRFEAAVEDLAGRQAQRLHFELIGPLAPWDFVDLHPDEQGGAWRDRETAGA